MKFFKKNKQPPHRSFLDALLSKPEKDRKKILLIVTALVGLFLISLFVFEAEMRFSNLGSVSKNFPKIDSLQKDFKMLGDSLDNVGEIGSQGLEKLKELNKDLEKEADDLEKEESNEADDQVAE